MKPPSSVCTVIVAVPFALPVTTPEPFTVAMLSLLEVQIRSVFAASDGFTTAVTVLFSPFGTVTLEVLIVTPVTAT